MAVPAQSLLDASPEERLALGRGVLSAQAFSRLLGTELTRWDANCVQLELAVDERLKQQNGFVHGGVLAYLADNALTFAGGGVLGPRVVTGEFKLNYLRPAIGQRLIARATIVHAGRSQGCVVATSAHWPMAKSGCVP